MGELTKASRACCTSMCSSRSAGHAQRMQESLTGSVALGLVHEQLDSAGAPLLDLAQPELLAAHAEG